MYLQQRLVKERIANRPRVNEIFYLPAPFSRYTIFRTIGLPERPRLPSKHGVFRQRYWHQYCYNNTNCIYCIIPICLSIDPHSHQDYRGGGVKNNPSQKNQYQHHYPEGVEKPSKEKEEVCDSILICTCTYNYVCELMESTHATVLTKRKFLFMYMYMLLWTGCRFAYCK